MTKRKVALVLSSGGARGYAHIGAIEALEERGFEITSVAGTSMGALVGGSSVPETRRSQGMVQPRTTRDVLSYADWALSMNHLVKGDKLFRS